MSKKQYGWHFVGETLRDGRPVPDEGVWLEHNGVIRMCSTGLHGSRTPFDALQYAPGPVLCYCEFEGIAQEDSDKFVAARRKIVAKGDATEALRYFARQQALSVVHLWDAPEVVLDYLATGDENLMDAAWAAAWDAARADAWDAARDAARAAAWAAARVAAWDAARAAARAAAWAAARAAAWDAARAAARAAEKKSFNELIYECFEDVL